MSGKAGKEKDQLQIYFESGAGVCANPVYDIRHKRCLLPC